jgi:hypothetical protein
LFLALIFLRKDLWMLILPLLILKPPRLARTRTEMKPKVLWRIVSPLCRLPLPTLRINVEGRSGNMQKT